MAEIEPHVAGIRAIHVPETGIIDYGLVANAFADDVRRCGGEVLLGSAVSGVETRAHESVVQLGSGNAIAARKVVVCTGVQSDRLARLTGVDDGLYRIAPFRGDYFELAADARSLVNGLVYPVPDPSFPFLGVHFTPRMNGEVWAGPERGAVISSRGLWPGQRPNAGRMGAARLSRHVAPRPPVLAHRCRRDLACRRETRCCRKYAPLCPCPHQQGRYRGLVRHQGAGARS